MKATSLIIGIFIITAAFSCTSNQNKPENVISQMDSIIHQKNDSDSTLITNVTGKYIYANDKDSIIMDILQEGDSVRGNLAYLWKDKDQNTGKFKGILRRDTIFADYNFLSEGKNNLREISFIFKGDSTQEGFGDVTRSGNKFIFENKTGLQYDQSPALKKLKP